MLLKLMKLHWQRIRSNDKNQGMNTLKAFRNLQAKDPSDKLGPSPDERVYLIQQQDKLNGFLQTVYS